MSEYDIRTTPEPGQLVQVRSRQWTVAEVQASYTVNSKIPPQHLVSLSSIEDDALGEELEVIWQIEPGARVIEKAGLPEFDGVDDAEQLEAFLDAVQWGAALKADKGFIQAPFRSGVAIEPHQLDPLYRAIEMARVNLLIADDVGLGKTIEAGLVVQEMMLRHRVRTVLVICPASLQQKWADEMLEKFGLEFHIVNTDYAKQLRRSRGLHANPWTTFPRLITSVDWIKSGEALRQLREILPMHATFPRKFDMLIVDEAHNVAPAGSKNYVTESQRTRLVREISPHFQHRLFLTATPHNGYRDSFRSLLELLDDQRFSRSIEPDPEQLSRVMVRRLKSELMDDPDNRTNYARRVLKALEIPYTAEERRIHALLREFCDDRDQEDEEGRTGSSFINSLLRKRLFSSPAAFAATLEKHYQTLTNPAAKKTQAKQKRNLLRQKIQRTEEDYADDELKEEALDEATVEASRQLAPLSDHQHDLMNQLRKWAQANNHKVDSKATTIIKWIDEHLKTGKNKKNWNAQRVIIFTEYFTTLKWLQEILANHGCDDERLLILHGGVDHEDREKIKAAFQSNPDQSPARILLATDAASEGIDLQNYCNLMIHLEIPYNPNVMEQRNGRIDRYGQRQSEVLIWHPVDGGSKDQVTIGGHKDDIVRALNKLENMRADMGAVNPLITPQISELIEGKRQELETKQAEAVAAATRKYFTFDRRIKERTSEAFQKLQETRNEYHLTPDRIAGAVKMGMTLARKPPLQPVSLTDAPEDAVFKLPELSGTWARCSEGLLHPHTGKIRPITFDHEVARGRDDVVLVHLNHRLVQMCLSLLRAEIWSTASTKRLHRITVRSIKDSELEHPAVILKSRLVIVGGNHHRLHEELTTSGGYITDKSFRAENRVTQLEALLEDSEPITLSTSLLDALKLRYEKHQGAIVGRANTRSNERLRNLNNTLEIRKQQESNDIVQVLDDLVAAIQDEIEKGDQPEQLSLFSEDERTSFKRDFEALKARLARIPNEKAQEVKAIEARYNDFKAFTFPAAAIFIVPASLVGDRS